MKYQKFGFAVLVLLLTLLAWVLPVEATTYTNVVGTGTDGFYAGFSGGSYMLTGVLDLSTASNKFGATLNTNDVVQMFIIPSNCTVLAVAAQMTTPATLVSTLTNDCKFMVGDGAGTASNGWIGATSVTNLTAAFSTPTLQTMTLAVNTNPIGTNVGAPQSVTFVTNSTPLYGLSKKYTTPTLMLVTFTMPPGVVGVLKVWAFCSALK